MLGSINHDGQWKEAQGSMVLHPSNYVENYINTQKHVCINLLGVGIRYYNKRLVIASVYRINWLMNTHDNDININGPAGRCGTGPECNLSVSVHYIMLKFGIVNQLQLSKVLRLRSVQKAPYNSWFP